MRLLSKSSAVQQQQSVNLSVNLGLGHVGRGTQKGVAAKSLDSTLLSISSGTGQNG